jgi:hypothetical protein
MVLLAHPAARFFNDAPGGVMHCWPSGVAGGLCNVGVVVSQGTAV